MDLRQHFERLLTWDDWANREVLASLRTSDLPAARRLFAHTLATEYLWLDRMAHRPQRNAVWPEWSLAECAARLEELPAAWRNFLRGLDARALDTEIAYVNTKGAHYSSTVGDVITHVLLHGSHHRGQIASTLRAGGAKPAYTDYIHAVREGCMGPGGD